MKGASATAVSIWMTCLILFGETAHGQISSLNTDMTPPRGNSVKTVLAATNAYQEYACQDGAWILQTQYATLVDGTTKRVVGNSTSRTDTGGLVQTFALFNSKGDLQESGDAASLVRGRPVASSGNPPALLLEAESHENMGSATSISYIQLYNVNTGTSSADLERNCSVITMNNGTSNSLTVPITADIALWTQDPLPATVPAQIASPGRVIDGFYGKGNVTYRNDGRVWVEIERAGTLHNFPGSPILGEFQESNGVQSWQIFNPNGFTVYAKENTPAVQVSGTSSPWTLSTVTSTPSSAWTSLGSFTYVQTLSTRGGVAPPTTSPMIEGTQTTVDFSAIFWFYTNSSPRQTVVYN